jgi:hypothetical protein
VPFFIGRGAPKFHQCGIKLGTCTVVIALAEAALSAGTPLSIPQNFDL